MWALVMSLQAWHRHAYIVTKTSEVHVLLIAFTGNDTLQTDKSYNKRENCPGHS